MIPENADSVFVPDKQDASNTSDENPEIILEETNLEEKSRQKDISSTQSDKILNEIKNFKTFQADVENKLSLLEDASISGKYSFKEDTSDNNTSCFAINILKDRISSLEDEVKSKDAIIAFLTQQLLSSKLDNSQMKRCECNRKKPLNVDESIVDDKSKHDSNLDTDNEINSEHKRYSSKEDIPVKFLSSENKPIEAFFFELNFHKKKWLVCYSYNPNKNNISSSHLEALRRTLDIYSALYENTILVGDFNVDVNDPIMGFFCESYNFKSLIKDPTCFKNPENPSCIDLILTNSPYSFQNSCVIETGLSDFHKMTVSVMKTTFQKLKPKIVNYRDYSGFSNDDFRKNLLHNLSLEIINTNSNGLEKFLQICIKTLDKMVPIKKKYVRGNNMPFFNKELSGPHKKRTQLRNRFLKKRSNQNKKLYSKQRNFCVSLLRKTKRRHYANLNHKDIADNK